MELESTAPQIDLLPPKSMERTPDRAARVTSGTVIALCARRALDAPSIFNALRSSRRRRADAQRNTA